MTIHNFMEDALIVIRNEILPQLGQTFTSHQFIDVFRNRFPKDYDSFRSEYIGGDPYQKLHAQIGGFLGSHMVELSIRKLRRRKDINVHGGESYNQEWEKISSDSNGRSS